MKKKVVYKIYDPKGNVVRAYSDRKQAKAFIDGLNWNIPSWHYDELYKMAAVVVEGDFIPFS